MVHRLPKCPREKINQPPTPDVANTWSTTGYGQKSQAGRSRVPTEPSGFSLVAPRSTCFFVEDGPGADTNNHNVTAKGLGTKYLSVEVGPWLETMDLPKDDIPRVRRIAAF